MIEKLLQNETRKENKELDKGKEKEELNERNNSPKQHKSLEDIESDINQSRTPQTGIRNKSASSLDVSGVK